MNIRLEEEKDYFEVENLTREAFWNVYRPGCFEHLIVHKIRNDKCFVKDLDYVIEDDDKIVANIIYAKSKLKFENGKERETLLFGPVSVLPEYQSKGYGSRIIEYTIDKARKLGYKEIFITGNPEYYKRFGFERASKYNVYYNGMSKSEEFPFFMVKILDYKNIDIYNSTYSDPECYNDINEKELEEFDKKFPKKIKEKRQGQLE